MKLTDRIEAKGYEALWAVHEAFEPLLPWMILAVGVTTLILAVGLAMHSIQKVILACC